MAYDAHTSPDLEQKTRLRVKLLYYSGSGSTPSVTRAPGAADRIYGLLHNGSWQSRAGELARRSHSPS